MFMDKDWPPPKAPPLASPARPSPLGGRPAPLEPLQARLPAPAGRPAPAPGPSGSPGLPILNFHPGGTVRVSWKEPPVVTYHDIHRHLDLLLEKYVHGMSKSRMQGHLAMGA